MIQHPSRRTTLALGALAAMTSTAVGGEVVTIADRCAVYGSGFVELGNGTCGSRRTDDVRNGVWTGTGASNAGLRSDGLGMLPGAGNARHLRIQVDPYLR